jgi:hypothetical protein
MPLSYVVTGKDASVYCRQKTDKSDVGKNPILDNPERLTYYDFQICKGMMAWIVQIVKTR